jgi:hypothetical protein
MATPRYRYENRGRRGAPPALGSGGFLFVNQVGLLLSSKVNFCVEILFWQALYITIISQKVSYLHLVIRLLTTLFYFMLDVGLILAQSSPPPPSGKTKPITEKELTPAQIAKRVDMTCPIKSKFTVNYKAVGGVVVDKDVTYVSGDVRYCLYESDLAYCHKNNPTPNIPCKLINRLAPRFTCPVVSSNHVNVPKNKSFGPWEVNASTNVLFELHLCSRAWHVDSCRYWHQEAAVTKFKNAGFFSVDRKTETKFTVCEVDQAAEAEFQARLKKSKAAMISLLEVKRKNWQDKCPTTSNSTNFLCKGKIFALMNDAQFEATELLTYTYDTNLNETMITIAKKYDPLLNEVVKSFN